jgi:hypothetical protein
VWHLLRPGKIILPQIKNFQKKFAGLKKLSIFAAIQQKKQNTFIQKLRQNVNRRPSYRPFDFW